MKSTSNEQPNLIRLPKVIARTGLSRSFIYAKISKGKFPSPITLGPHSVAWVDHEITEWINHLMKDRKS